METIKKIPESILKRLEVEASLKNSQLVTTEKDAARLPKNGKQKVLTLPVRLSLNDEKKLNVFLINYFKNFLFESPKLGDGLS